MNGRETIYWRRLRLAGLDGSKSSARDAHYGYCTAIENNLKFEERRANKCHYLFGIMCWHRLVLPRVSEELVLRAVLAFASPLEISYKIIPRSTLASEKSVV